MYFSKLPDSRDNRGLKHELGNIIVMSIYAALCGYTDAENMAFFMKLQEAYFTEMLDLKHGVPSADTLLRVFALIEPESFMQMFYCWIQDVHFREDMCKVKTEKAMQNLALIRKICYNLMKLDKRFDKKKNMTYKKMSMLYNCNLKYIEELIFYAFALSGAVLHLTKINK